MRFPLVLTLFALAFSIVPLTAASGTGPCVSVAGSQPLVACRSEACFNYCGARVACPPEAARCDAVNSQGRALPNGDGTQTCTVTLATAFCVENVDWSSVSCSYNAAALTNVCIASGSPQSQSASAPAPSVTTATTCVVGHTGCVALPTSVDPSGTETASASFVPAGGFVEITGECGTLPQCRVALP